MYLLSYPQAPLCKSKVSYDHIMQIELENKKTSILVLLSYCQAGPLYGVVDAGLIHYDTNMHLSNAFDCGNCQEKS